MMDDEGNVTGSTVTGAGNASSSSFASSGSSEHEAFRPVLGRELSSVESLSIQDQLYMAMAALQVQGDRHAVARLAGCVVPAAFLTNDVVQSVQPARWADEYREQLLEKLPAAMPLTQALDELETHHMNLRREIATQGFDEDAPAKRRLKKP